MKMKAQTLTRYEVVCDESNAAFEPCGIMTSNKKDALKALRITRERYPDAYLAKVTYIREPETKHCVCGSVRGQ